MYSERLGPFWIGNVQGGPMTISIGSPENAGGEFLVG
jgi:hypothetical protein